MKKYVTQVSSRILFFLSWQSCCVDDASAFSSVPQFPGVATVVGSSSWTRENRRSSIGGTNKDHFPLRVSSYDDRCENADKQYSDRSRRRLLASTALAFWSANAAILSPQPAHAGLLQFPCDLNNRYHFMRAGLSELEADNIYSTNALFLTNRDNAMVTNDDGSVEKSIRDACRLMRESGETPTVVYHSLAANGMDTGDLLARTLVLGRDRLLPEFTYLDQRGIGLWDSSDYTKTKKAIMAMDYYEAGQMGTKGRPPANEDGTPNETLQDQFIRLRQFLSLQESRTSGENILVIFPDGTGPALLSCMIAGIPFNECHCLDYAPGEIRLNIDRNSVRDQYNARKDDPNYLADLEEGKEILEAIRKEGSVDSLNIKQQRADADRAAVEEAYLKSKERQLEADRIKQEQLERAREEAQRKREESERARLEAIQKAREEREEKAKERREEQERQRQEQIERFEEANQRKKEELERMRREKEEDFAGSTAVSLSSSTSAKSSSDVSPVFGVVGLAVAGLGGVAALAMGGDDDDLTGVVDKTDTEPNAPSAAASSIEETKSTSAMGPTNATTVVDANSNAVGDFTTVAVDANNNASKPEMGLRELSGSSNVTGTAAIAGNNSAANGAAACTLSSSTPSLTKDSLLSATADDDEVIQMKGEDEEDAPDKGKSSDDRIEEESLNQIESAKDIYFDMLEDDETSVKRNGQSVQRVMPQHQVVAAELSPQKVQIKVTSGIAAEEDNDDDYYDSGFFQRLVDIRDEEDYY